MNYEKIYNDLIQFAQNAQIPNGVYKERHHIIPKFIAALKAAGLDSISNETLSALEDANYSTALDIILDNHLNSEPF